MAKINGTTLDDNLTGTTASDTLDGRSGSDTMSGFAGDDTYIFDRLSDIATELAGDGSDTVQVSFTNNTAAAVTVDMSTASFDNIEALLFTRTGLFNGIGNMLANTLTGNASVNVLAGGLGNDTLDGGAGADTLDGGADDDTYLVDNAGDVIIDASGHDAVLSKIWSLRGS